MPSSVLKNIFSYFWSYTEKLPSDHNGIMEITWYNGRKMLNSKSANYSYGSLQKSLEFGISKIDLTGTERILLLGLGGGSIIKSLRDKYDYHQKIDAVEIDAKIIELAKGEFGISASDQLIIENADAFEFVSQSEVHYDLIIVDLFIDTLVPTVFYTDEFYENLKRLINVSGAILFNVGINLTEDHPATDMIKRFKQDETYSCRVYQKVQRTNTLLIAQKVV